jgi:hypothetical protein
MTGKFSSQQTNENIQLTGQVPFERRTIEVGLTYPTDPGASQGAYNRMCYGVRVLSMQAAGGSSVVPLAVAVKFDASSEELVLAPGDYALWPQGSRNIRMQLVSLSDQIDPTAAVNVKFVFFRTPGAIHEGTHLLGVEGVPTNVMYGTGSSGVQTGAVVAGVIGTEIFPVGYYKVFGYFSSTQSMRFQVDMITGSEQFLVSVTGNQPVSFEWPRRLLISPGGAGNGVRIQSLDDLIAGEQMTARLFLEAVPYV